MNVSEYRQASELFHILSHQARLQMLDELRKDEACVCHLQTVLGRPQAYISQQLRVLREAGVVTDRRDGPRSGAQLAKVSGQGLGQTKGGTMATRPSLMAVLAGRARSCGRRSR